MESWLTQRDRNRLRKQVKKFETVYASQIIPLDKSVSAEKFLKGVERIAAAKEGEAVYFYLHDEYDRYYGVIARSERSTGLYFTYVRQDIFNEMARDADYSDLSQENYPLIITKDFMLLVLKDNYETN